jgi:Co/Zn/Cd efflux system component
MERERIATYSFCFFAVLRLLYELRQDIMSWSAVSPDFICSLVINILNLLVNVLLLWQSQKLFVVMVCLAESRNVEKLVISDPLTVLQKQRDTDTEATTAHLCVIKEKLQTEENPEGGVRREMENMKLSETEIELTEKLELVGEKRVGFL